MENDLIIGAQPQLKKIFSFYGANVKIVNAGIGAANTVYFLHRIIKCLII